MSYFGCTFLLFLSLFVASLAGRCITSYAPWRVRPLFAFFFSPAVGIGFYLLLASLVGWFGPGFHRVAPALVALISVVALVHRRREWRFLPRYAMTLLLVAFFCAPGIMFCLLRYDVLSPYNDAFGYQTQAQWLQHHAFLSAAPGSVLRPAFTQVSGFRCDHLRMGASFLLGWWQAVYGVEWAHEIYPVAIALPLGAGCLALAGVVFAALGRHRRICVVAGLLAGVTLNSWTFGSVWGFLPQTYGLLFSLCGLGMTGIAMGRYARRTPGFLSWRVAGTAAVPIAVILAAHLLAYPEALVFCVIALAAYFALLAIHKPTRAVGYFRFALVIALGTLLLANFELLRTVPALLSQSRSQAVNLAVWPARDAILNALGLLSGPWDRSASLFPALSLTMVFAAALGILAVAAFLKVRRQIDWMLAGPFLAVSVALGAAFLYFRFVQISPWTHQRGYPWNEFRAGGWTVLPNLALAGTVFGLAFRRHAAFRWPIVLALLAWEGGSMARQYELADFRTRGIRQETGYDRACLEQLTTLRARLAGLPANEPIGTSNFGPRHDKILRSLAYIFYDRDLAADWRGDDYVARWLPAGQPPAVPSAARWSIVFRPPGDALPDLEPRVGNLVIESRSPAISLLSTSGGYDEERVPGARWRWTKDALLYRFRISGSQPQPVRIGFSGAGAGRRTIHVTVLDGDRLALDQSLPTQPRLTPFELPLVRIGPGEFSVRFDSPEPPVRLGSDDPRLASFMIRNLSCEAVAGTIDEYLQREPVLGGYPAESDASGEWNWTPDRLRYEFAVLKPLPSRVTIRFTYLAAVAGDAGRPVTVRLFDDGRVTETQVAMKPGWHDDALAPVPLSGNRFAIEFISRTPPQPPSGKDQRSQAFLIKNLTLELTP